MGKILVIEDSDDLRESFLGLARKEGYTVVGASSGHEARGVLDGQVIDLVFLDLGLPDMNGLELIPVIKSVSSDIDIVVVTGMDDAQTAVRALKAGVVDYILKPFDNIEFRNILTRIMKGRMAARQHALDYEEKSIGQIIGESAAVVQLREEIHLAADVRVPVLVEGETGTGKELVARAIHNLPEAKNRLFVKVDCGTLSAAIIESELFGYERGAFTDAKTDKKGLVEIADGGTLFLDEIGNLSLELQPKLLRIIEESMFRRVGGVRDIHVDVRIIAATNITIDEAVRKGRFREDLYHRLNVMKLRVPPLRDRGNDTVILAYYYLERFARELKKQVRGIAPEAERILISYDWPGNIRELRNSIERAVIYCKGEWLTESDLKIARYGGMKDRESDELVPLKEMERRYMLKVLSSVSGNKTEAARLLGISRATLRDKLKNG